MSQKNTEQKQVALQELTPTEMLTVILSYAAKITQEKNIDRLLMLMADLGRELIIADRCSLWLIDKKTNELWTKVAHGVDTLRVPADKGIVGHAVQSGGPLTINDPYNDDRFNPAIDKKTGYKTKAILVIPIQDNQGEILGAYQAINKMTDAEKFLPLDEKNLTIAASYTAQALQSALLYKEIEETQKEIIFKMGEIGESRSKETGNHVKRVALYSEFLALKYGLSEEEAELIKNVSPMHDIGKVQIPDSILHKPGKLTEEEFAVIKNHTLTGHDLLKGSDRRILKAASIVAEQHHEKWNGRGYPLGLKGEEIHIYGRITAVADVFDALGSDRSYKKAWELDRILNLFKEERGEHFDPDLIDVFLENIDGILEIRNSYSDI